jgi:hypothetical protein
MENLLYNAILTHKAVSRLITFLPCKPWTSEYVAKVKRFEMRSLQTLGTQLAGCSYVALSGVCVRQSRKQRQSEDPTTRQKQDLRTENGRIA